jgi:hypothetical protein
VPPADELLFQLLVDALRPRRSLRERRVGKGEDHRQATRKGSGCGAISSEAHAHRIH